MKRENTLSYTWPLFTIRGFQSESPSFIINGFVNPWSSLMKDHSSKLSHNLSKSPKPQRFWKRRQDAEPTTFATLVPTRSYNLSLSLHLYDKIITPSKSPKLDITGPLQPSDLHKHLQISMIVWKTLPIFSKPPKLHTKGQSRKKSHKPKSPKS